MFGFLFLLLFFYSLSVVQVCFKCNLVHCTLVQSFFYMFSFVLVFFSVLSSVLFCSLSRFTVVMSKLNGGYTNRRGDNGNWSSRCSGFLLHSPPHVFSPIAFFSALFFVEQFVRFFALDFTGNVALVLFVLLLPLTAVGNH